MAVVVAAEVDLELVSSATKKVIWLESALMLEEMNDVEVEVVAATASSVISLGTWLANVLTQMRDHLADLWSAISATKRAILQETVQMQATMTEVVVEVVAAATELALSAMKRATYLEIVQMEAAMTEVVVEVVAAAATELALSAMKKATCLEIVQMEAIEVEIPTSVLVERLTMVATLEETTTAAETQEIEVQEALGVAATIQEEGLVVVPGEKEEQQLREETGTLEPEQPVAGVTSESITTILRKLKLSQNAKNIQQLQDLELDLKFYLIN